MGGGLVCASCLGFGGWGHGAQKCGLWPHSDKTGFPKGLAPWHTTLLARCSVLYLLARLAGEAGRGAACAPLHPPGKRAGFCERKRTKSLSVFRERRQVYKPRCPEMCLKLRRISTWWTGGRDTRGEKNASHGGAVDKVPHVTQHCQSRQEKRRLIGVIPCALSSF